MKIRELMTRDVECLTPDASLKRAAELMSDADVGGAPVVGPDGRVVGVLTDRDIVVRTVASGRDPGETPVSQAMTPEVYHCHPEDDVEDAAELMAARQVRRVVVTDENGGVAGIVALSDLARADAAHAGDVLEEVSRTAESAAEREP